MRGLEGLTAEQAHFRRAANESTGIRDIVLHLTCGGGQLVNLRESMNW